MDRRGFYTQLYAAVQQASLVPLLEEEGEGGDACGPGLEQGSVEVGGVPPPGERVSDVCFCKGGEAEEHKGEGCLVRRFP